MAFQIDKNRYKKKMLKLYKSGSVDLFSRYNLESGCNDEELIREAVKVLPSIWSELRYNPRYSEMVATFFQDHTVASSLLLDSRRRTEYSEMVSHKIEEKESHGLEEPVKMLERLQRKVIAVQKQVDCIHKECTRLLLRSQIDGVLKRKPKNGDIERSDIVLGIDLGATHSRVAYADESGQSVVIPNSEGDVSTPSIVYFECPEYIVVGKTAKKNTVLYRELVVENVRQYMGGSLYKRTIHGIDYTPEMISSLILHKLAKDAAQYFGFEEGNIKDVVITCPAHFGINERNATKHAGELAGLNVLYVLKEPVAAAYCYGLTRSQEPMTALVYDLGSNTFDITLLLVEDGKVEVLLTDSVQHLGGKNWDEALMVYLAEQFVSEYGDDEGHPLDDPETKQQLRFDAEEAKKALSAQKKRGVVVSHGGNRHKVEITREKFEKLIEPGLKMTVNMTRNLLERAKTENNVTQIDKLILVGGSTRIPKVREELRAALELEAEMVEPDQSIAKGAAIVGKLIRDGDFSKVRQMTSNVPASPGRFTGSETSAVERTIVEPNLSSKSYGIAIKNPHVKNMVNQVIPRNVALPYENAMTFATHSDNQSSVSFGFYEQAGAIESEKIEDHFLIMEAELQLPPGLPKGEPIEITFRLSPDGRLQVTGRHKAEVIKIEANVDGVMSKDEMKKAATLLKKKDVS